MRYQSYMKLCDVIDNAVRKDYIMASTRESIKQLVYYNTHSFALLYLLFVSCWRGSHHDIHLTAGMSKTSFSCYAHRGDVLSPDDAKQDIVLLSGDAKGAFPFYVGQFTDKILIPYERAQEMDSTDSDLLFYRHEPGKDP